jgi:ribosome-associated protein
LSQALVVSPSLTVPAEAIAFRAVRSSGPGGQNVNKVASKVELRVELDRVVDLPPAARSRLLALAASRLDAEGRLVVVSQKTRDQSRNLEDARAKLRALLLRSLVAPRPRTATRPSRASKERRLEAKRRSARRKRARGRPAAEE